MKYQIYFKALSEQSDPISVVRSDLVEGNSVLEVLSKLNIVIATVLQSELRLLQEHTPNDDDIPF